MEQKHIDEIDESFLGEEFIDDDVVSESHERDHKSSSKKGKKTISKKAEKRDDRMEKKHKLSEDNFVDLTEEKEELDEEVMILPVKESSSVKEAHKDMHKDMHKEERFKTDSHIEKPHAEVKTEAKTNDPWKEEEDDSFFKDASTWKAITGIAVVLLLLSIFTQGFNFSDSDGVELSLGEAEEKTLTYVNNQLLSPPFVAEVAGSSEQGEVYKITLSIAGEQVDSYLTKDGGLFFPQGFNVNEVIPTTEPEEPVALEGSDSETTEEIVEEPETTEGQAEPAAVGTETELNEVPEVETQPEETIPSTETTEVIVPEEAPAEVTTEPEESAPEVAVLGNTVQLTVNAKKWLFEPHKLSVKNGDSVELTIVPSGLDFTFAVPEFAVEQEVKGTTTVSFTADKTGSFEFKCSSCEAWRGMTGTVTVE